MSSGAGYSNCQALREDTKTTFTEPTIPTTGPPRSWGSSIIHNDVAGKTADQISITKLHREPFEPTHPDSNDKLLEGTDIGQPLQRFILRGIFSIIIPLALIAYYVLTYIRWLRYPEGSGEVWITKGYLDNAEFVNYSWFVLSAFGLNLGTYCIGGSVASMTMTKIWSPANSRVLLELAADSFADPSNWVKSFLSIFLNLSIFGQRNGLLWNTLTVLNIMGFIAWPFTGLTMQTVEGFAIDLRNGPTGGHVLGRNQTTFNQRNDESLFTRETSARTSGLIGALPRGQLYTAAGSMTLPNVTQQNFLPEDASTPIFLAPQTDYPFVADRVFGLLISYNCTVVNSTAEFSILNRRRNPDNTDLVLGDDESNISIYLAEEGNIDTGPVVVRLLRVNTTNFNRPEVNASMEVGTTIPLANLSDYKAGRYLESDLSGGINQPVLMEVILWQNVPNRLNSSDGDVSVPVRDVEGNEIKDLRGLYRNQKAIGCRCFASSDTGFASINGIRGSYSNFTSSRPTPRGVGDLNDRLTPQRFEHGVLARAVSSSPGSERKDYRASEYSIGDLFTDWYYNLLTSAGFYWREVRITEGGNEYLGGAIQADDLRSSLLRIHHSYALQLMYDGNGDTSLAWPNPNINLATPAKVLVRGVIPPEVVLGLLGAWALGIVVLSALYQFRRRWAEKLNTFNMFVLGLNINGPVDIRPEDLVRGSKKKLEKLPGTIGDLNAGGQVGAIGLTRGKGTVARRNKPYTTN